MKTILVSLQRNYFSLIKKFETRFPWNFTAKKDQEMTPYLPEIKTKQNILNTQFQSVFTPISPLNLSHLCQNTVHEGLSQGKLNEQQIPDRHKPQYPTMPAITISANGILKLLANLKPEKASGPDGIKPLVLKKFERPNHPNLAHIIY